MRHSRVQDLRFSAPTNIRQTGKTQQQGLHSFPKVTSKVVLLEIFFGSGNVNCCRYIETLDTWWDHWHWCHNLKSFTFLSLRPEKVKNGYFTLNNVVFQHENWSTNIFLCRILYFQSLSNNSTTFVMEFCIAYLGQTSFRYIINLRSNILLVLSYFLLYHISLYIKLEAMYVVMMVWSLGLDFNYDSIMFAL